MYNKLNYNFYSSALRQEWRQKGAAHMKKLLVAMLAALMVFAGIASAETGTYAIHSHRPCGSGSCSHSAHSSSVTYQPLTKDNFSASISTANSTGYYYLAEDISMAYDVTIPETSSVYLCLNGHTIKSNQNSANAGYANLFVINGSLDLSDCQGTGAIDGNASSYWSTRIATVSGKFNMWSGTLQNGRKVQGGAIYVLPKSTAVFNMYGGTIKNCTADSEFAAFGGAIYAPGYTTDIYNNITADETTSCSVNIYGGTITGNTAEHSGGAIYASRAAKVYIQGGTISNNTCRYSGGSAIHYEAALRELSIGGVTIRGGTITGHSTGDAAVYIARNYNDTPTHDDLNMLGGSIIENSVTGLYTYYSRAYIDGASISFNGGWGIETNNANVVLYDTTVTGNTSGGVDVYRSQLHLGGKMDISGNGNNTNVNLASGRLISMSYAPLTTGSKVGVTVAGKTSSNVVRFLTRPGGGSITEDYLVGFSSDQFYPMGIDSDTYGVMGDPITVTAQSSNTNYGTVTGGGTVNKGTQVFLTATAKEGYQFVNWTDSNGDQVSTNAQFYYAANANATLTANFVKLITITTTVNAEEGGVVTDGVTVAQGSMVTMFATPNEGYLFVNWTDANGNEVRDMARYSDVFNADTTLTANFAYNISLLIAPHAAVDAGCMAIGAEPVLIGSGKTLTIKPSESGGYVFVNWTDESGNVVSTSKTYTFAPDRPTKLIANFALPVTVTAQSADATMGSASGTASVLPGTSVTVKATPNEKYAFVSWTDANGDVVSTDAEYTFTASETCTLTANFVKLVTITLVWDEDSVGVGAIIVEGSDSSVRPSTVTVPVGTKMRMYAEGYDPHCYRFLGWYLPGGHTIWDRDDGYKHTASYDLTLEPIFALRDDASLITVNAAPAEGGTVTGGGAVVNDTSVTMTATPNTGYRFVNWTENGEVVSTDAAYTFTANGSRTLTANFADASQQFDVTVNASPSGIGTMTGGGKYTYGTSATVTATAPEGYTFLCWEWWVDGIRQTASSASHTFTVTDNITLTACFMQNSYSIRTDVNSDVMGYTYGDNTYVHGESVTVTATPNAGHIFVNWTDENGTVVSTDAEWTFTATGNTTLTANFERGVIVTAGVDPEGSGVIMGAGTYKKGTEVTLIPGDPTDRYAFIHWVDTNGQVACNDAYFTFTANEDCSYVAVFGEMITITANVNDENMGSVSGADRHMKGTEVTLTATPKQGYRFLEWQENGATVENAGASYTFTVESARTLTAVFGPQQYGTLTINKQMNGATLDADLCYVTLNGQTFTSGTFGYGDTISLTPVFPEDHFECHGFQQQGHEDGYGGSDTFTFTMPEEPNVVMNVYFFPRSFDINVTVEPAEAASATQIGGTGTGLYGSDRGVDAYCYEDSGYVFYGWYDSTGTNLLSTNSSYDFVIKGKTDLIAKVVPSGEYVRIEAQPSDRDGATVSGSGAYQVGSTATLTVTTNSGYTFVGWEGNSHEEPFSTATSITVDVPDHNMYYTAIIAKDGETHTLNISAENGSVVNKNGVAYPATSEHESSKYVHLLPKPNDGYEFDHWEITEDRHSYNTDREDLALTMTHNWTVKAVFREVTYRLDYDVVNGGEGGSIAVSPNYASGAELDKGIEVTLTATPDTEYEVYEWVIFYGDESFEDATHITDKDTVTVTMTDDVRVTLEFRKPQQGGDEPAPTTAIIETRVEGDGSVTADTDPIEGNLYELPVGEEITLTATPGEGHVFLRWDVETPDASLTEEYSTATITLAPEKHTIAKAVFIPDDEETLFEFAISTRGSGEVESTHEPDRLPAGTEITLIAKPETGGTFKGWHVINMGNGSETVYTDETLTIKLTKDTEVLAEFSWVAGTTFNLSFYTYGEGYINTSHQAGAYAPGTEIELTAIPADGWRFSRWVIRARGGESREDISTTITLEADTEIHVEFLEGDAPSGGEDEELFFFDYFIGDGEGMVSANYAPEAMLPAGTEVTLKATPAEGYVFSVWTIDTPDSSSDPTEIFDAETTITIQENTYAFALFNRIGGGDEGGDEPELRIFEYHVNGNGSVESSHESGEYEVGTEIMLQAIPGEGATFIKWIIEFPDAGISEEITDAELPITLDENTVVIAEFSDDGGIGGEGSDTPVFEYSVSGNGSVESSHENGNYDFGTDIMLKAIPNEGATFIKWIVEYPDHDSTEVITDEELLLTLDENTFVTAEFSAGGGIGGDSDTRAFEYSRSGNGSVVSSHENGNYAVGTEITLQAFPDVGAVFARWLVEFPDAGVSTEYTEESITIVLTENTVVVAQFADDGVSGGVGGDGVAQLFLLTDGNGRIECEYESGEFVPLGTSIPVTAIADEGFVFSHWVMEQSDISGAVASSEQSIEIILTTQTTLTAYFVDASTGVPDCELALATEGSGTLTGTSAGVYPPDTAIMLTAVPEDMWRVCAWLVTDLDTGDSAILETNQTEFTFVLRQNVLITVVFEPGYVIEAKANDEALGTVTGSGVYYAGEEVTLTATPADEQSLFTGWYAVNADGTINLYSEESELVFSPTSDLTLVAWFTSAEVAQYVINTTAVPEVGGLVTGEGFYDEGATVTLTATANDGYTFIGWYENNTAITTEATLTFTAESNRNIEARFDAIEEPSSTVTLPTTSDGGTVSGAGEYEIGATVTVTATPEAGFIFNGWYVNGELVSTDPTYTFVVNGDVTLTPEFTDVRTKLLIITHPADAELFADETAVFSVTASGDGPTYQWQQSSRTLARTVNWINIDGATLPTYQVEATVERDGTQYRCIVTDQYGNTLTSDAATLTVLENPVLPPTGDGFNAALWLAMLAVSTVGVILLRKRVRG